MRGIELKKLPWEERRELIDAVLGCLNEISRLEEKIAYQREVLEHAVEIAHDLYHDVPIDDHVFLGGAGADAFKEALEKFADIRERFENIKIRRPCY